MISEIKCLLKPIIRFAKFICVTWYDAYRFYKYSAVKMKDSDSLLTGITTNYHIIEKGLSFSELKHGFGRERIFDLLNLMVKYKEVGGCASDSQYLSAIAVLQEYVKVHSSSQGRFSDDILNTLDIIKHFLSKVSIEQAVNSGDGGCKELKKSDYLFKAKGNFYDLAYGRSSIRTFSNGEVSDSMLYETIRLAQKSPSTCNRQSTRIYLITNNTLIQQILNIQGGTRGFGKQVQKLFLIAGDLRACLSPTDRNQVWVDAGMFAMSLLYALQYKGLGACILHWAVERKRDLKIRQLAGIKPEHTVICLIGVGHLTDTFKVPCSQRKELSEILTMV